MTDVVEQAGNAAATGGGSNLGKGAWDCDTNKEIPPIKEARARARARLRAARRGACLRSRCAHGGAACGGASRARRGPS
jgi:hypothetical protein